MASPDGEGTKFACTPSAGRGMEYPSLRTMADIWLHIGNEVDEIHVAIAGLVSQQVTARLGI